MLSGVSGDLPAIWGKLSFGELYGKNFEGGFARIGLRWLKEESAALGFLEVPAALSAFALTARGAGRGKTAFINN